MIHGFLSAAQETGLKRTLTTSGLRMTTLKFLSKRGLRIWMERVRVGVGLAHAARGGANINGFIADDVRLVVRSVPSYLKRVLAPWRADAYDTQEELSFTRVSTTSGSPPSVRSLLIALQLPVQYDSYPPTPYSRFHQSTCDYDTRNDAISK